MSTHESNGGAGSNEGSGTAAYPEKPDTTRLERGIGALSVKNPVLVNILMFTVIALGAFSMLQLPQEQFAEVPFYWVNIIVPYPGVSAEDLETIVTIPVENEFQGIDNLKTISSTTSEGLSVVRVEFDDGISQQRFETLFQDSQTRFNRVDLPDGILNPVVDDFSSADFAPVIEVVLSGDLPYAELRQQALRFQDDILGISEVSSADIVGLRDREITLTADPSRMASLGLSSSEILQAVQDRNSSIPGGTLSTEDREFILRTVGSIREIDDFQDVIIRRSGNDGSGIIRLRDVARVSDGFDPDSGISRINGDTSLALRVTKVPGGSSLDVVQGIRDYLTQREEDLPGGLDVTLLNDSTVQIRDSLSVLTGNALMGLALLVVILALFIGLRNALMTALGIPVTFALTFIVLELLGETINTNTLFGLVLVLGLIVDHAIVIIENSYRMQQSGLSRHDAAIAGTNQVVWPVIAATATTVAAFLPLMIIPGTIGRFLRVIPLTVAIALIASTWEALYILPSHFADWGRERKNRPRREHGAWFKVIRTRFDRLFARVYPRRGLLLAGALVVAGGSFALIPLLNQDLFAAEDFSYFTIDITMPRGTPLDQTDAMLGRIENRLMDRVGDGEVLSVLSTAGSLASSTSVDSSSNVGQITVDLTDVEQGRSRSIDAIIRDVQSDLSSLAGPEEMVYRKAVNGPPTSSPLSFTLSGDNYPQIIASSEDLQEYLRGADGVFNVEDNYQPGNPEIRIQVNEERATALGLSVSQVGNFIRAKFDGLVLGRYFEDNEEIEIVLRYATPGTARYDDLVQSSIPTQSGRLIPFSSVASVDFPSSAGSIRRVEGKRQITVTADAVENLDLAVVNQDVEAFFAAELASSYPDVEFGTGGEFSEFQDLIIQILRVFLLGIFLIYLILGAQFKSYSQPLIILISVPFSFVGVVLYLALSGTAFSTTVLYAGVALAGIAVNDAIVLISFINELRDKGASVGDAVREAAGTRLRPIMLTSLTTIAGLLPTALGIGGSSVVWGPMASTIIFGLLFSTITALFIIPGLYGLLYDRRNAESPEQRAEESGGGNLKGARGVLTLGLFALLFLFPGLSGGNGILHAQQNEAADTAPATAEEDGFSILLPEYPRLPDAPEQLSETDPELLSRSAEEAVFRLTGDNLPRQSVVSRLLPEIRQGMVQSAGIQLLDSALESAQAQYRFQRSSILPGLSIGGAGSPSGGGSMFSYTRGPDFSAQPVPGNDPGDDESIDWSMSLSADQALPTGGQLFATASAGLSQNRISPEDEWSFALSPSVSAGLSQPLFLDGSFLRFNVLDAGMKAAENGVTLAQLNYDEGLNQQSLGMLRRLSRRLDLIQELHLLEESISIQEIELQQITEDAELGLASQNQLDAAADALEVQKTRFRELENSIREIQRSISADLGRDDRRVAALLSDRLLPSPARLSKVPDWADLRRRMTEGDPDILQARYDMENARAALMDAGQADAPRLSINMNYQAPFEPTEGGADNPGLLENPGEEIFTLTAAVDISDPFRRSFRLQKRLHEQRLRRNSVQISRAEQEIELELQRLQEQYGQLISSAENASDSFVLQLDAYEQELILHRQGGSSDLAMRRIIRNLHQSGFTLFTVLRELSIFYAEISLHGA
ncbi:efflux RND transporter permease subunit [Salinispira pacifica]|uniref:Acriflavin resistance protein n=1 Tax=Salinispira pacifica TaxID=1307761 RepID=V5WK81_9SPIO|nr:efflux RND transporter permease subunit [Salinispira pacifica]AHC16030.1 Acriflavin resistance protein [Salinispira pacifica]